MFVFFITGCVQDENTTRRARNKTNTRNKTNCMGALILAPAIRFHEFYDCIKLCRLSNTPCMYAAKHADLYNKHKSRWTIHLYARISSQFNLWVRLTVTQAVIALY